MTHRPLARHCAASHQVTKRNVPTATLLDSMTRVPASVEVLTPFADFVANVKNHDVPTVGKTHWQGDDRPPNQLGTWSEVSGRFAQVPNIENASPYMKVVEDAIAKNQIVVFSKTYCSYCHGVKVLLRSLNAKFHVIEFDEEEHGVVMQVQLVKLTNCRTVPQVFLGHAFVGGCDAVLAMHDNDQLVPRLALLGSFMPRRANSVVYDSRAEGRARAATRAGMQVSTRVVDAESFYALSALDADGNDFPFEQLRNRVALLVNVASA